MVRADGHDSIALVTIQPLEDFETDNECRSASGHDAYERSALGPTTSSTTRHSDSSGSSQGHDTPAQSTDGKSGIAGASFNFMNSIVGAGIIGLAYAIQQSGFVTGILMLLLVALATDFSVRLLVRMGVEARVPTYEGVSEHAFGTRGFYAVSGFMAVFAFGAMVAYLVILGDTIPEVMKYAVDCDHVLTNRQLVVFLSAVLFVLPLCLLRDMSSLSKTSSVSVAAVVVIVVTVAARASARAKELGISAASEAAPYSVARHTVFSGVSGIAFAFVCHHSSFFVYNSLRNNSAKRWKTVTRISVGISAFLSVVLALVGYTTFYSKTKPDILNNWGFDDDAINMARLLLASTMVFTFPMEQYVVRHSIYAIISRFEAERTARATGLPVARVDGLERMSDGWHYGLTLFLWSLALFFGLILEDLGIVLDLTGSLSASFLGFIWPMAIFFRLQGLRTTWEKGTHCWVKGTPTYEEHKSGLSRVRASCMFFGPAFIFVFGLLMFFFGTAVTVFEESTKTAESPHGGEAATCG